MMRYLLLYAGLLWLAACGDVPPVPTDYFYRLTLPEENMEKQHVTKDTIYIRNFIAEGLYNERALLYTNDQHGRELQQQHYHFWITSPPRLLRDYLAGFLRATDSSPMIIADGNSGEGWIISGRVIEFEKQTVDDVATANVGLELRLDVSGEESPRLIKQYRLMETINGKAMTDVIAGFNSAAWKIYNEFLVDIRGLELKTDG